MLDRAYAVLLASMLLSPAVVPAQILMQPTPAPTVTAENEPWFVSRAPLIFGGIVYYPAGPQVHFNRNEMVPTGFFGAVPVYARTTLEPRSVIFIPLSGGLMQPYERRRSGPLAGTEGSIPPSFPVANAAEEPNERQIRAAGPPTGATSMMGHSATSGSDQPASDYRAAARVGTAGAAIVGPNRLSAARPQGLNAVFVEFASERWYNDGQAVPFDAARFQRVGDYHALPVYSLASRPGTIFVPVSREASALVVPYSKPGAR